MVYKFQSGVEVDIYPDSNIIITPYYFRIDDIEVPREEGDKSDARNMDNLLRNEKIRSLRIEYNINGIYK